MKTVPTRTRRLIAVCAKCGTKAGGGFGEGGKRSLAKALRRSEAVGKGKRAGVKVVETRCLGLCPKRAVVMVDGARPGEAVIVPVGTPVAAVLDLLGVDGVDNLLPAIRHSRESGNPSPEPSGGGFPLSRE